MMLKKVMKTETKNEQEIHSILKAAIVKTMHRTILKTTVLKWSLQKNKFCHIYISRILKAYQTGKIIEEVFYDSVTQILLKIT